MRNVVYMLRRSDGLIKIGQTDNSLDIRMKDHCRVWGVTVELLATVPGTKEDEKRIHHALRHYRIRGPASGRQEIFDLDDDLVAKLVEHFNEYNASEKAASETELLTR